ncbi:MAG: hypothetical protein GY866_41855 [Proteobacteria bacterium]|nr:hypothetical protein [Pseudomonadota bacterium]
MELTIRRYLVATLLLPVFLIGCKELDVDERRVEYSISGHASSVEIGYLDGEDEYQYTQTDLPWQYHFDSPRADKHLLLWVRAGDDVTIVNAEISKDGKAYLAGGITKPEGYIELDGTY